MFKYINKPPADIWTAIIIGRPNIVSLGWIFGSRNVRFLPPCCAFTADTPFELTWQWNGEGRYLCRGCLREWLLPRPSAMDLAGDELNPRQEQEVTLMPRYPLPSEIAIRRLPALWEYWLIQVGNVPFLETGLEVVAFSEALDSFNAWWGYYIEKQVSPANTLQASELMAIFSCVGSELHG